MSYEKDRKETSTGTIPNHSDQIIDVKLVLHTSGCLVPSYQAQIQSTLRLNKALSIAQQSNSDHWSGQESIVNDDIANLYYGVHIGEQCFVHGTIQIQF